VVHAGGRCERGTREHKRVNLTMSAGSERGVCAVIFVLSLGYRTVIIGSIVPSNVHRVNGEERIRSDETK
jgi:hypothetical protein